MQDKQGAIQRLSASIDVFSGKKILITGASGFIGSHLLDFFNELNQSILNSPCHIHCIDSNEKSIHYTKSKYMRNEYINIQKADIRNYDFTDFSTNYIIHAAGIASPSHYMARPMETIGIAVNGTQRLLEMATRCSILEGFLFFSSSEVYGDPGPSNVPITESYNGNVSTIGPRACYDESKRLGETLCSVYNREYGIPTKIVRPFNIYGPGMFAGDSRIIPTFTFQVLNNRPMTVYGSGVQTRSYCHVEDAICGFIATLLDGRDGEPYNIGNPDDEISARSLAMLFSELHQPSSYELNDYPNSYPGGEASRRCPDITKASNELGYSAKVTLRSGLLDFINWAKREPTYNPNG